MSENQNFSSVREKKKYTLFDTETRNRVLSETTPAMIFHLQLFNSKILQAFSLFFFMRKALNNNFGCIHSQTSNGTFKPRNYFISVDCYFSHCWLLLFTAIWPVIAHCGNNGGISPLLPETPKVPWLISPSSSIVLAQQLVGLYSKLDQFHFID